MTSPLLRLRRPNADTLTDDQVGAIHDALRFLAARDDDMTTERNGVGFSRNDTYDGHYLAGQHYLTAKEAKHGLYIVWKYHRTQLPDDLVSRIMGRQLGVDGDMEIDVDIK